ncbi:MAG: DNA polymerase III subunit delta [Clostridia bacterium]|nr:DNA polymerase III subunit delta [Clostridia bacterium]
MHEIIKEADFRREIKGEVRPCYFFFGEEDYLKNAALKQARATLGGDPAFDIFNYAVIDGREYDPDKLLDVLAPPPMMADRKLIILQDLDLSSMKQADFAELCTVLGTLADYDYNTLIVTAPCDGFDPGVLPKRPSAQLKALCEVAVPVHFERSTPAKLAAWAQKHYAAHGAQASAPVAAFTIEYCGRDMFALVTEIDKIACYALSHGRREVTEADVRAVATPVSEFGAFAFANAISEGRRADALQILDDMKFRRIDPVIVMGEVIGIYAEMLMIKTLAEKGYSAPEIVSELKINEYKLARYLKSLRGLSVERMHATIRAAALADSELKSGAKSYAPLEKLICS